MSYCSVGLYKLTVIFKKESAIWFSDGCGLQFLIKFYIFLILINIDLVQVVYYCVGIYMLSVIFKKDLPFDFQM